MTDTDTDSRNLPTFSVSEVSAALKRTIEDAFGHVRVRGEISGFKRAASGHVYLALKDEKAVLDGVMWRGTASGLRFRPENGLEVICEGRITTYAARSRYQIVIETMRPAGVGALLALLEERRKKLAAEGLFDEARKQPIPYLPDVIGVVTSPTGAVIRDILHRLRARFPRPVLLWPVLVQGEGAAEQIAAAIRGFNALAADSPVPRPDVLIVARGGGSIEDLWAFNEEVVVRAAADSAIPLISAVGHETDTTLIDFASDKRAPTPTAAAEMAVPVRTELLVALSDIERRRIGAMVRALQDRQRTLEALARSLPKPERVLEDATQRLDERVETLGRAMAARFQRGHLALTNLLLQLTTPHAVLARDTARLTRLSADLGAHAARRVDRADARLQRLVADRRVARGFEQVAAAAGRRFGTAAQMLESLSYRRVLARGYAVVRDRAGVVVQHVSQAEPGAMVDISLQDGVVPAVVGNGAARPTEPIPRDKPKKAGPTKGPTNNRQGELL